jgi:hypothetical protein
VDNAAIQADLDDQIYNRGLNQHYSHDIGRGQDIIINPYPVPQAERSPRQNSNTNHVLHDEVSLINKERFILIKLHAVLIRNSIDDFCKEK